MDTEFDICFDVMEMGHDLNTALVEGDLVSLKRLLESQSGDDVNKGDKRGRTVLHTAACRGLCEAVTLLLDHGADVNVTDSVGNTPLHWCGRVESIDLLVERGADILACNNIGATPRMMALRRGVSMDVISAFEKFEVEIAPETQPLLSNSSSNSSTVSSQTSCAGQTREKLERVQSIWYEFCVDLGPQKLLLLVLTILVVSLYVAFTVTGLTKHTKSRIPIVSGDVHKVEL